QIQSDVVTWPTPSLARLRGTVIGAKEFVYFFPNPSIGSDSPRYEEQIDAVLYLGSPATMTTSMLPAALCADEEYVSMRVARMQLDPGPQAHRRHATAFAGTARRNERSRGVILEIALLRDVFAAGSLHRFVNIGRLHDVFCERRSASCFIHVMQRLRMICRR